MMKTRSKQLAAIFPHKKTKSQTTRNKGGSENGKIAAKTLSISEQSKRSADMSPMEAPARKRSAFGDITNAIFNQHPEKGSKLKEKSTTKAISHAKELRTSSSKRTKRTAGAKESHPVRKGSSDSEHDVPVPDVFESPSGEFCSSQDSVESSSSSTKTEKSKTGEHHQNSSDSAMGSLDESASSETDNDIVFKDEEQLKEEVGENNAKNEEVVNIDADVSDPFMVSEYADEIFRNMKTREDLYSLQPYMARQDDITPTMRAILVDWLVEVQENFELYHETLYLGVKLLDHYLAKNRVVKQNLQLVGATSLFISCKVEERHPPCLDDFLYICDDAYQHDEFVSMEKKILANTEYDINIPIPYRFLRRYAKAAFASVEILTLARFVLETTLQDCTFVDYKASFLAAACLDLALLMKDAGSWTPTLVHYTGYTKEDLKDCVLKLNAMISEPPKKNVMTVRNKYSHKVFHEVAKIPPLDVLTLHF